MFPGSEDVYKAWSFVWYAWFVLRLQRVASVAFGREILALRKAHLILQVVTTSPPRATPLRGMPWIRRVVTQVVGAYRSTSPVALGVAPKRLRGSPRAPTTHSLGQHMGIWRLAPAHAACV